MKKIYYYINNDYYCNAFPESIINEIKQKYKKDQLNFNYFEEIYKISMKNLQLIFLEYKKTYSHRVLEEKLKFYNKISLRLNNLGMNSND